MLIISEFSQVQSKLLVAGMVDVDKTIFVQLAIFLALIVILKLVLFDPFLKLEDTREEATSGARKTAAKVREQCESMEQDIDQKINDARMQGTQLREELKAEGRKIADKQVEDTRTKIDESMEAELLELKAAESGARAVLSTEARRLADLAADRILQG
ncbi:MAG: hypothetical protein CMH54_06870 [Myxococcales bacterium]|nr:hypothetical protein [Myxococcales bacterium]